MIHADVEGMDRALALSDAVVGSTAPNPPVGALLVRGGEILGEGSTQPVGGPHAEAMALQDCRDRGNDPAGATMYVTLEPCCHEGRTPPCTAAIEAAGVARVVVGVLDPFPAMRGQGVSQLRGAGIAVVLGVQEEQCARRILGFARALAVGLPEVTLKAAISLDGHIATAAGESQWISGPASRQDGHRLRARHDAILVGIGTALADDPRLTARPDGGIRQPVPVVFDTTLRLPPTSRLLDSGRAIVVCAEDAPEGDLPARILRVPRGPGGIDVVAALRGLTAVGLHRILVEGGGRIHRTLLDARLVDTVQLYVAGTLLPGGRPWVGGAPLGALSDALRLDLQQVRPLESDLALTYGVRHGLAPDPLSALRTGETTR